MNSFHKILKIIAVFTIYSSLSASNVTIETNNSNAAIFLNDSLLATGNFTGKVDVDTVYIKVVDNVRIWNSETFTDTVLVDPGEDYKFAYTFVENGANQHLIQTIPGDVEVIVGDSLVGRTPLYISQIDPSTNIILQKYGYQRITLNGINKVNIPVELTKSFPMQNQTKFTESNWFYILLGSAALLGATAAYFKAEADSNFDEYEKTDDKSFLDKTDRFDTYSGIALGALQINFGVLIYEFLTD